MPTPLQASVAVAALFLSPGAVEAVHSTVTSAGQVISGPVVSSTVMICSQLLELLHSSVVVQVRVIVSLPPQPGAELSLHAMDVRSPQVSLPVALPLAPTPVSVGHSSVIDCGQAIEGAVMSMTSITWTQLELFPQLSVADQVRKMLRVSPQPGVVSSELLIS